MRQTASDRPAHGRLGHSEIDCLLVGSIDPLTLKLRSGAAMRYLNPPNNVRYSLSLERLGYPKYLGYYSLKLFTTPLSAARLFAEALFPLKERQHSIVHSFYWSVNRHSIPWIHENDQSLSQFFSGYINFKGAVARGIVEISAAIMNSRLCKSVIVWSDWARKGYADDGVDKSKIKIIPPPFPVIRDRIEHTSTNILFLGRDFLRKGGDITLKVFNKIHREFDNAHLIYVGKIRDQHTLREIEGDPSISYFESVTQDVLLRKIFPVSDVFLLPCRAEAFGMSVIEAMSRGIPVVSTRISALPEIIDDGVTGYFCPPNDLSAFTEKIARLVGDPKLRERMGENARNLVSKRFSKEIIGEKLYTTYLDAMG